MLGMRPQDFDMMTDPELVEALQAFGEYENNKLEMELQQSWEQARFMAVRLVNIQLQRKDQYKRAVDFHRFPWDKEEAAAGKVFTKAEIEHIRKLWAPGLKKFKDKYGKQ